MAQVGIISAYQLGIHNHLNNDNGGILHDYSRHGAFRIPIRTGALAISTDSPGDMNTNLAAMTKIKELRIDETRPARVVITYEYWSLMGGVNHVDAQLYINGVAVGPLQHGAGPATITYNHDAGFTKGDLIQVWGRRYTAGDECHIDNFSINYDWAILWFGDGTQNVLVTALPVTDIDELAHTAIL
jgi:hypothetical protein